MFHNTRKNPFHLCADPYRCGQASGLRVSSKDYGLDPNCDRSRSKVLELRSTVLYLFSATTYSELSATIPPTSPESRTSILGNADRRSCAIYRKGVSLVRRPKHFSRITLIATWTASQEKSDHIGGLLTGKGPTTRCMAGQQRIDSHTGSKPPIASNHNPGIDSTLSPEPSMSKFPMPQRSTSEVSFAGFKGINMYQLPTVKHTRGYDVIRPVSPTAVEIFSLFFL